MSEESTPQEKEQIREAMRILGRSRSPRKRATSQRNIAKARERVSDPDVRAKLREAQKARREREREERIASGELVITDPKPRGRPRKELPANVETTALKRGRGRPKKAETGTNPQETIEGLGEA